MVGVMVGGMDGVIMGEGVYVKVVEGLGDVNVSEGSRTGVVDCRVSVGKKVWIAAREGGGKDLPQPARKDARRIGNNEESIET